MSNYYNDGVNGEKVERLVPAVQAGVVIFSLSALQLPLPANPYTDNPTGETRDRIIQLYLITYTVRFTHAQTHIHTKQKNKNTQ